MFLAYLTLITALTISAVAIYYSVSGLAAIFAAAVIPIIIMGGVLESAKLVAAVWLHKYWDQAKWWLKTYLSVAVAILMLITSMGIFGFLSRAHIEQTSLSVEQAAQSAEITEQLERLEGRVERWNEELNRLFSGSDVRVDSLLAREQEELNTIYARIEREKNQLRLDAQNNIVIQNNRLEQAKIRKEQAIEIARQRFSNESDRSELDDAIQRANSAELSVASAVQREIISINRILSDQLDAVDSRFESQISDVQGRINQLRTQSTSRTDDIDQRIIQLETQLREEQLVIADLRQQRSAAEREFRMLEAEVGPIKYIAEFVYGEKADKELLEEAVRLVIIIIIFVFDPLAVLLLIASQYTFEFNRKEFGIFSYKKEPEPNPEDDPDLKKTEPKSDTSEDEWPTPDTGAFAPPTTPEKPYDGPVPQGAPFNYVIAQAQKDEKPKEIELDFSLLQPSIDEFRNALKKWEDSKQLLEQESVSVEQNPVSEPEPEPEPVIDVQTFLDKGLKPTDGKTYQKVLGSDYIIDLEGKSIHKDALRQQLPDLVLTADSGKSVGTSFGTEFPNLATKGDIFIRVDQMPNRIYKFVGHKWLEINKETTDTYLFDEEYIKYLIAKIESGEYDVDLLSDKEKTQIEEYLQSNQKTTDYPGPG